ncbi:MAG: helix-turn-helix domain-containing protein [Chitinophagaceae bacterium]
MDTKTIVTKEQIVVASKQVFKLRGYNDVTMAHIAAACGMGRSSLYYYFKNKEQVFTAFTQQELTDILNKAASKIKVNRSFYDNFLNFNRERLRLLVNLLNDYQNLLNDVRENLQILHIVRNATFQQEYAIFRQMLVLGMKSNDIAAISVQDLNFLTTNLIYALKGLEQEIFLFGKIEELTSRLDWVTSIISKGLK